MSFRIRVFETKHDTKGSVSGIRLATDEAQRSGEELASRWFGFDRFTVEECEDAVNYEFPADARRPVRIEEVKT